MDRNNSLEIIPKKTEHINHIPDKKRWLPPWLYQHQDLINALENAHPVDKKDLTNMLNHIHFTDRYILAHLLHAHYQESLVLKAYPEPCLGKGLTCHLSHENLSDFDLQDYQFLHFIIDDGKSMILVPALLQEINGNFLTIQLPKKSYAVNQRKAKRYECREVIVELSQSGFQAKGKLLDFSPIGYRIKVEPVSSSSFHWFNPDALVTIKLRHDQQILFSGLSQCIRQQGDLHIKEMILIPIDEKIKRFKKRQTRNPRQHLVPSATITFHHPFLKKRVQREVADISTSGFSVYEKADESVLLPGMIIPELTINFAGILRMKCTAQVIYRLEENGRGVHCGLAILDTDITTYSHLTHILTNSLDPQSYIFGDIDTDDLWEFFFDTGFIYPTKYRLIQSYRKDFKETYRKLYQQNPEIARHFTFQKNGRINGHISIVRAYDRAWLIHHHVARTMDNKKNGLMVLKQIMHYLNDIYRLPSANMDYVMCYFRPESKFPDRVFGGFARALKNPRTCSLDLFSYFLYNSFSVRTQLPDGWSLKECLKSDFWELNRFYNQYSGGLFLDALGLLQQGLNDEPLEGVYRRLGFLRKWKAYCLKYEGELHAVLIVNESDLGLNLSELLNGITILVTNGEGLPWDVLSTAIAQLTLIYHKERVPILCYPFDYIEAEDIPYEKQYQAWVLNAQHVNECVKYMQRKLRIRFP